MKGLRHGGPLLPYLFIFCAESLNLIINIVEHDGDIQGVAVSKGDL